MRNLITNAGNNPARFGCSVIAVAAGLTQLYSGSFISGGIATFAGAKELYNQAYSGDSSTLKRLLDDINADVDMIKTLEEGQQQSFKAIDENLILIRRDVDTLYGKLDQIKDLNAEGLGKIEAQKHAAYEKGIEAKEAYRRALKLFDAAKTSFASSKQTYQTCANYFTRIQEIAKDEESDTPVLEKINALVKVAKQASGDCEKGKGELDKADEKFTQAMEALSTASKKKDEAVEMISRVVQSAEDTLKAGLEKAEYAKECTAKINAAQRELQEVKERSDNVMRLLEEMSDDIEKAKTEAQGKLGTSDVVVGTGIAAFMGTFGMVQAIGLGVTVAYAWHNGTTIADTTKKVYNYFFNAPLPPPEPMRTDQHIRVNLDEKSSGYYGRWIRWRPSYTLGSIDIKLGDEVVQYRFDLNRSDYPLSKEDMFNLCSKMFTKLRDNTLSPEDCEKVLSLLENSTVNRGELHPSVRGLIKPTQAAHCLVRELNQFCGKLKETKVVQV